MKIFFVGGGSGKARELAFRLSEVRRPEQTIAVGDTVGYSQARGATVSGSLRGPSWP